jgi:aldose 1-epimerase
VQELHLSNGTKVVSILRKITNSASSNRDEIFTNAKLSPFAGRISDGSFKIGERIFHIPLNYPEENNACHGFVYDKKFSVVKTEVFDDRAFCLLKYDYNGEIIGYPFKYSIELTYTLTATGDFICETRVNNHSEVSMPFSDGWHHYFDIGEKVNDLKLELDVFEMMELDERNIPTGKKIPFSKYKTPEKIGEQFFDSCFRMNTRNGKATTRLISERNGIDLEIWQETGLRKYNYLVIYTPSDRKSIAIEPMSANINALNNKEDLIMLEPKTETRFQFGVTMKKTDSFKQ